MAEQSIHDLFDTVPDPEESVAPAPGKEKSISELFDQAPVVIDRSVDPDRAARIQRAVDELGVPRSVAQNKLDELEAKRPTDMSGAPVTEMYMRDRNKAELMSDEAEILRDKERAIRGFWNNTARAFLERGQTLIGNELEIAGRYLADDPTADLQKQLGVESVLSQARSEAFTKVRETGKEISDEAKGSFDYQPRYDFENFKGDMTVKNLALYALETGVASLPDMIAAVTSLPLYAASFTQEVGEERAKNMGLDEPSLKEYAVALPTAIMSAAMERFGAKAVLDILGVFSYKQAAKAAGSAFLKEGVTEIGQEVLQYAAETIGTLENFSFAEAFERGVAAFLAGSLFGGTVRGVTATTQATVAKLKRNNSEQDIIDQMNDLAEIKLKGRSKKQYDAYIEDLTSSYGIESVHVDGKVFNQSLIEEHPELEKFVPEDGDAEIGMKDYLALPKAIREALRPHVRLTTDSLSQVEAQTYEESQMARMDDLIKNALKDQGDYDRAIEIANVIAAQIEATSAPYTKRQAQLMSRIYVDYLITKAKDQGMTVDEVWNQMQLEVGGPQSTTPFVNLLDQMEIDENRQAEAKGLDMSTEARMARAEGMGLDVSRQWVHQTGADVAQFDPDRLGENTLESASSDALATTSLLGPHFNSGGNLSTAPGSTSIPVYLPSADDMLHIGSLADLESSIEDFANEQGIDITTTQGKREAAGRYVQSLEQDYLGITYDDSEFGGTSVVVFDPANIRSINAAFDPDYVASPNLLAQSEQTFYQGEASAIHTLQMAAERGERAVGTRSVITSEEAAAIRASASKHNLSIASITRAVRAHKLAHPTAQGWSPLVYNRTVIDENGKVAHEYKSTPYDFSAGLKPGTEPYDRRVAAIARAMAEEVRQVARRAAEGNKNARNILAQAGWYKAMRSRLRQEFGGLGDLFADLLGATSPNTPVRDNWTNAIDSLRRASRGDYDMLIPQWEAWADRVDELEFSLRAYFNTGLELGLSKKTIKELPDFQARVEELKAAKQLPDSLLPKKESGKKYGFNGRNVARAMVDLWRVVKNADPDIGRGGTAPKALNFSGNLIGFRERATIDVWAARMIQRLNGGTRIPSMAEGAVSGNMLEDGSTTLQFGFGQDVFTEAVKLIRADSELNADRTLAEINDDDLQAVVWFIEKELWTVNNWTNAAGEGGSFELEANLSGSKDQSRIKDLRKILDSSKSKPEAKAQARDELAGLERTVDRFTGGLSVQMSADTQGVDYVPTDSDMARLANRVTMAAYEADDGNTVMASKALSTEGRYGGVERSLDLEVVAREGYNANSLWLEMLRQAQGAKQDSTFLSRVLRDNEDVDPLRHRPGVEIYFQTAAARAQLETVLSELAKEGVEFLTVIVDGRRSSGSMAGEMPAAVGVRLQYVPEFEQRYGMDDLSGLDDQALSDKINQKAADLDQLASRVSAAVEGVSFAGQFWYDTQVAFSHQYQEKIDAISTGTAEGETAETGSGLWSGESIRSGIESADRQARETTSTEPGGDVLGGDAQREVGQTYNQSSRSSVVGRAKSLGLPATGKTESIANLVRIVESHPSSWSREDFDLISPYLSIHQDVREGSSDRVESIMRGGLKSGMADNLQSLDGKGSWSWANGLLGGNAYVFLSGNLKYQSKDSPYLAPGNKPLFVIPNTKGQDIYSALQSVPTTYNQNDLGFYSALARGIESATIKAAAASGWKAHLKSLVNKGQAKADEIYWTGIEQWLDLQEGKVTKESVMDFLEKNGVRLEEMTTDPSQGESQRQRMDRLVQEEAGQIERMDDEEFWPFVEETYGIYTEPEDRLLPDHRRYVMLDVIEAIRTGIEENETYDSDSPQYEHYVLDGGGKNYREIRLINPDGVFTSSHWNEKGIVAHIRVNDRATVKPGFVVVNTDSGNKSEVFATQEEALAYRAKLPASLNTHVTNAEEGLRTLFVEEIQSDWAQKGKKEGFQGPRSANAIAKDYDTLNAERRTLEEKVAVGDDADSDTQAAVSRLTEVNREMTVLAEEQTALRSNIHRGPFVTSTDAWVQLALKRLMIMAVKEGYDRVAFINGEQSAERYDLSKQIDVVFINKTKDGLYDVSAQRDRNSEVLIEEFDVPLERVEALVGKDLAKKAEEQVPGVDTAEYRGVDLKVGGEGMKAFYDKIIPSALKKMSGKSGISLDVAPIQLIGDQLGFDITDELRELVSRGMPLFQKADNPDATNRASIEIFPNKAIIRLSEASDLSSFFHESGHFFLEMERKFAESPNATERQKKDWQIILDYLGVKTGADIGVKEHELFARTLEMYFAEGRAPSVELRPFFRRFAQWIVQVYKSLRNLDVELTPAVRGFMDRMFATDEQIERAHQKFGFDIAFNSAKQVLTGKHKAKEDLRAKLIKELKSRQTAVWKQEKSEKVDRIKKELSESRLYKTIDRLKETPLRREDVLESLDIENLSGRKRKSTLTSNVLPIRPSTVENVEGMGKLKGLTAEKGLPLDEAAQLHGYPSGQAMLYDIMANPTLAQEADSRADAEMFREHGDMLSDGSIEELADRAVLNNDQAKALLEELRALKRGKIDREAIEQEAKDLVGKMPADKINPEKYYRLAIKEAHLYQKAMSAKKFDEAAKHKEQQLKLFYVAREAQIMKDRTRRMMKSLKGWQTREYRPTEVDPEYAQNLRTYALLYDFSKTDKERAKRDLSKLARWLEAQAKDENNFLKPVILDEIMNKLLDAEIRGMDIDIPSYKEMTIDELQGVFDMATHFRYAGGQLSKSAKAERELVADELAESIESNAKGKDILPKDVKTNWDKWKPTFSRFFDDHIVLRNKIALLDGFIPGAAKKYLYDAISAANNRFVDMQMDASRRLQDVFDGHHVRLFKRGAGLKTIQKENGGTYTLGLRERIMLGVYWGSPESRKALLDGQGITEADAQKMLDHLTDKDLDLIEKIWKFNDHFWPEFSAQTTRMHGSTPPKVENAPFEVNGRKMSGGYMRLYYEHGHKDSARKDIDADSAETSRGSASLAMTRAGASYERVGSGGRRVDLDVINIGRATEETVHGLAFSEVSREIQTILNNEKVSGALEKKYGLPFLQSLRDTYKGIFAKGGSAGGMSKVMAKGRSNLTYAYLAYSIRNVMQQPTAIFNVVGKMGEVATVKAIVTVASSPKYWAQFISERSSFMRNRFALVNREAAEQLMKIDTNKMNATLKQYAFSLQTIADSLVAYPAWVAGYKEGQRLYPADEALAVQHADDVVASTVGSGMSKDLSAMMAGFGVAGSSGDKASEFTKQFTFMGSFFSTIHNLMSEAYKKNNLKTPMGLLNYSRQMMWYLAAPALISQLIVSAYPEDDDPEAWLAWMAKNIAQYGLATTFLLRDIGSGLSGFSPSIPWQSIPTAVIRGGKEATEAFSDGGFQLDDTASIIRAASVFMPLYGAGQVARSLDYWNSYLEGDEGDFSLYDMLVEGKERDK